MNIYEKLLNIQIKLKAPKGQFNKFGKYKYRSCEDILEAVKPICAENKAVLTVTDEVISIENRFYVKATALLTDVEKGEMIANTAYAREEQDKKGMDGSQITGTASSYARKYALNGLFCIDDTKDADTNELEEEEKNKEKEQNSEEDLDKLVTEKEAKIVYAIMKQKGLDVEKQLQKNYQISNTKDLTKRQYAKILVAVKSLPNKQ